MCMLKMVFMMLNNLINVSVQFDVDLFYYMSSLLWIVDLISKDFSLYFLFQLLLFFSEKNCSVFCTLDSKVLFVKSSAIHATSILIYPHILEINH